MSKARPVTEADLIIGQPISDDIFDQRGTKLLAGGSIVVSERHRDAILTRGAFFQVTQGDATSSVEGAGQGKGAPQPLALGALSSGIESGASTDPFELLDPVFPTLREAFKMVVESDSKGLDVLHDLAMALELLHQRHPAAMLGAVHLVNPFEYTVCHPVHCALLALEVAGGLNYPEARRLSLTKAALMMNVSVLDLQDHLQQQDGPLSDDQRAAMRLHPEISAILLEDLGLQDVACLRAIRQHHERLDGEGYPVGLSGQYLSEEAQILSLCDRYGAMISSRAYRECLNPQTILKEFYVTAGSQCTQSLIEQLIARLGIYPPGSFVLLANGETGLVIRKGLNRLKPVVAAYADAQGQLLESPRLYNLADQQVDIRSVCGTGVNPSLDYGKLWQMAT